MKNKYKNILFTLLITFSMTSCSAEDVIHIVSDSQKDSSPVSEISNTETSESNEKESSLISDSETSSSSERNKESSSVSSTQNDSSSSYSSVNSESSSSEKESTSSKESSSKSESSSVSTGEKESNESSSISKSDESSSVSSSSEEKQDGPRTVSIYAMNDFHGSVNESGSELGILKNGSFFKDKANEDNTLILNSGDLWQGSIESNYNRGELLTKVMNYIGFDCLTLGNHEFDWGSSYIEKNKALKDENTGYSTPFLAANIYNYDISTKTVLDHADNLGQEYVIRELENGLRIGIIGVIGKDQITSICSQYSDAYVFTDPVPVIQTLSDKLRTEEKCDVIIADVHTDASSILGGSTSEDTTGITSVSPVTNKKYADAVLCAHSHVYENYTVNDVPFVQGSCNGKSYSEVQLKVETDGNVYLVSSSDHQSDVSDVNSYNSSNYDSYIVSLVNQYKEISDKAGNEILGTLNTRLSSAVGDNSVPNLVCTAMADFAETNNISVDYTMTNQGRAYLYSGNVTYANLYKSLPFDNLIYILECKGKDIINEAKYNSVYRVTNYPLESDNTYTIAVIDYLALHRNVNRIYDYFPSATIKGYYTKEGYDIYNYRDLTADYIRKVKTITSSMVSSSSNIRLDKDSLTSQINDSGEIIEEETESNNSYYQSDVTLTSYEDVLSPLSDSVTSYTYSTPVYAVGKITKVVSTSRGVFYMEDLDGNSIYVYGLYASDGKTAFSSLNPQPAAGDVVVIKITALKTYSSTKEVYYASLYQINGIKA